MSKILMAGGRKSKDKSEKPKKKTDKSASKKEKRSILREMSKGEFSGSAFTGLLAESSSDFGDEEAAKPIRFSNGGAKRYHYGSQQSDVRGSTSLGFTVSKFTSFVMHKVELDDTWTNLSLHYSISIDDIRRFNKMYASDALSSRKELMIPINDENRHKVDASDILSSAAVAAARATSPETPPPDSTAAANAGPADADPIPPPKPSASDFLAKFDSSFNKTKSSVLKKSDDIQQPAAARVYGSSGALPNDKRIGNGLKGDTSHVSYQNRTR